MTVHTCTRTYKRRVTHHNDSSHSYAYKPHIDRRSSVTRSSSKKKETEKTKTKEKETEKCGEGQEQCQRTHAHIGSKALGMVVWCRPRAACNIIRMVHVLYRMESDCDCGIVIDW